MPFFLMDFYNMQGSTGGHLPLYKQGSCGEYSVDFVWAVLVFVF